MGTACTDLGPSGNWLGTCPEPLEHCYPKETRRRLDASDGLPPKQRKLSPILARSLRTCESSHEEARLNFRLVPCHFMWLKFIEFSNSWISPQVLAGWLLLHPTSVKTVVSLSPEKRDRIGVKLCWVPNLIPTHLAF
jgi:hypothetical protein